MDGSKLVKISELVLSNSLLSDDDLVTKLQKNNLDMLEYFNLWLSIGMSINNVTSKEVYSVLVFINSTIEYERSEFFNRLKPSLN